MDKGYELNFFVFTYPFFSTKMYQNHLSPGTIFGEVKLLSHVHLFVTLWTVVRQASPSMGFSRQEYWSGVPLPSPLGCHFLLQGIFLTQGSNLGLPHCRQVLYPLSHEGSPTFKQGLAKLKAQLSHILIFIHSEGRTSEPVKLLSCDQLFETPWTVAYQAPPSMEFSRQ